MVRVAQLVRASDCGSEGRGFEPLSSPPDRQECRVLPIFVVNTSNTYYLIAKMVKIYKNNIRYIVFSYFCVVID